MLVALNSVGFESITRYRRRHWGESRIL